MSVNALYNLFIQIDELLAHAGGELTPEVQKEYDTLKDKLSENADLAYDFLISLDAIIDSHATKIEHFTKQKKFAQNSKQRVKDSLLEIANANGGTIKGNLQDIKIRTNQPKLIINEDMQLPLEYFKTIQKRDDAKIKKDLKSGTRIEGAKLEPSKSIYFSRKKAVK